MFRLIRLPILLGFAFVGGVFYERANQGEACAQAGGQTRAGLCIGAR